MAGVCCGVKAGYERVEVNKTVWELPARYQALSPIGLGAYGQVVSARDDQSGGRRVAVKKIKDPFLSDVHAKRTYRELRILRNMFHENIISLLDCFTHNHSLDNFNTIYLVMPLMGADLHHIMKTQRLSNEHVKFFIYQILRGLKYLHSAGIIHRDLKPANIAVNEDCDLKIIDFGLARHVSNTQEEALTGYVETRWYRAPEVMLNWRQYTNSVDIWSVGCIMAEMLTGTPLFQGATHVDHLKKVLEFLGSPNEAFMEKISSENAKTFVRSLPVSRRMDFTHAFPDASPHAVHLLEQMLELDQDGRIKAGAALAHPYLQEHADLQDEPSYNQPYDQSFENTDLPLQHWKRLVYEEVSNFSQKSYNCTEKQRPRMPFQASFSSVEHSI